MTTLKNTPANHFSYNGEEFEQTSLCDYVFTNAEGKELVNSYYDMDEAVTAFTKWAKRAGYYVLPAIITNSDTKEVVALNDEADNKDKAKTFTLYRADVLNPNKSGSIAVFDTTYYLDRDMDWDTQDEYELPKGWRFVDGDDGDFSYLVTDNNQILDGRSISHYKTEDTAGAWYTGKKGATKVLFKKVTDDSI